MLATRGRALPAGRSRRSTRLKGFDYRSEGAYFVTVVAARRDCTFGEVVDGMIRLGATGRIVARAWRELPIHFPHIALDAFVVMPNHMHGILWIDHAVGAKHASPLQSLARGTRAGSLSAAIQSFKSASTRKAHDEHRARSESIWQRGFYDHAVRSEEELNRLRRYIEQNPLRWALDKENQDRTA